MRLRPLRSFARSACLTRRSAPPKDDGEGQETAADRAFIDRSGELEAEDPFADSSDDDDEAGDAPQAEEAEEGEPEEEDDLADAFKSKSRGKRRVMDHEVLVAHAESLLEKMKAAYEADLQSGHRRQPQKRKLLMLRDVVAAFQDHYMSEVLLCESDGLTVLRMWLEPMPATMVLPNVKLRTEIFRVLRDVNLEVEREDVKERLKKSQLAKVIMFYSKVGDELVDNRRICQRLIQTWSEAIFGKMTRHSAEVDTEEESARVGRLRAKSLHEQKDSYGGKDLKRMHAFVPAPVPMDFVHRPKHGMRDDHMGKSEYKMEKEKKLKKKLAGITAKNKKGQGQASNVSVEGRGLVVNL